MRLIQLVVILVTGCGLCTADEPNDRREKLVGYTLLQAALPGGRHANVRTMRAMISRIDGTHPRLIGESLVDNADAWTQFAGWSPDGMQAIVYRGWQNPDNAVWEEEHRTFRMQPGQWQLDSCLVDVQSGAVNNLTAIERVSHYNGGLFFLPEGRGLGFTPLINGNSKPFVMDLDGRRKRDVSGDGGGFAYGYSASPDGKLISYHENYQVYVADADGKNKRRIETGNPFNFAPRWSPDGQHVLFVSGVHGRSNVYLVHRDGSHLRKLVDLGGYQGWVSFLDVRDFHNGSSDLPVWSNDGSLIFFTALVGENVELFQTTLDGKTTRLTTSAPGTLHYHPTPSPDGRSLLYGSKRDGARNLFVRTLTDHSEKPLTTCPPGVAAMWPHWQP